MTKNKCDDTNCGIQASKCCKAGTEVGGETTHFYVCRDCHKTCDLYVCKNCQESAEEKIVFPSYVLCNFCGKAGNRNEIHSCQLPANQGEEKCNCDCQFCIEENCTYKNYRKSYQHEKLQLGEEVGEPAPNLSNPSEIPKGCAHMEKGTEKCGMCKKNTISSSYTPSERTLPLRRFCDECLPQKEDQPLQELDELLEKYATAEYMHSEENGSSKNIENAKENIKSFIHLLLQKERKRCAEIIEKYQQRLQKEPFVQNLNIVQSELDGIRETILSLNGKR